MGLDCFWEIPEGKKHPTFEPPLSLCGGMFSANGTESFRGKVYSQFIEEVSGISIYEDLTNEQVKEIADASDNPDSVKHMNCLWEEDQGTGVLTDLKRMFREYADIGATLRAWY